MYNTALGYGIKLIVQLDFMKNGLNWSTLWQKLAPYDILCIGKIVCIMTYTSILFLAIVLYIDPIFPGAYGVAKPFYYLFTRDYWGKPTNHKSQESVIKKAGIKITDLCKSFQNGTSVVTNVSFTIYKNEITVLVGNNGSGKNTIVSIIIGMMKATSGTVLINGYDIQKSTRMARKSMSHCPQQNILFDELTIREHILFYSYAKGMGRRAANEEVKQYVELFQLETKVNKIALNLSYGTQRKLSVAIALCGQSQVKFMFFFLQFLSWFFFQKFVFLEHPTNGMDPTFRRSLWNVLSNEKKGRHILVTTHLPDEVDVIGDRIVVLRAGQLQFNASSIEFKKRFGRYRLICVKDINHKPNTTILDTQQHPHVIKELETENQLIYQFAYTDTSKFGEMFELLDKCSLERKINHFSVSHSSAEFALNE